MDVLYDPAEPQPNVAPPRPPTPKGAAAGVSLSTAKRINIQSLAADLVLFGADDLLGVLDAHGLGEDQLQHLLETNAALRSKVRDLKKQVEADPKAVIRLRAASALESHIKTLHLMASDTESEPKDRRESIKLLAELADALPKADKGSVGAGIVLQMNFGDTAPPKVIPAPLNRVIEPES